MPSGIDASSMLLPHVELKWRASRTYAQLRSQLMWSGQKMGSFAEPSGLENCESLPGRQRRLTLTAASTSCTCSDDDDVPQRRISSLSPPRKTT